MPTREAQLLAQLRENPTLYARIETILNIAADKDGSCETADDAEDRTVEELRNLGNELLTAWAEKRHDGGISTIKGTGKCIKHGKKKSIGSPRTAK
jgi:hypothetical protein